MLGLQYKSVNFQAEKLSEGADLWAQTDSGELSRYPGFGFRADFGINSTTFGFRVSGGGANFSGGTITPDSGFRVQGLELRM